MLAFQVCFPQLDYEFSYILCVYLLGGWCYEKFSNFLVKIVNIGIANDSPGINIFFGLEWYLQLDMN